MVLSLDTVFWSDFFKGVKMLYIPKRKSVSEKKTICNLLESLKQYGDYDTNECIDEVIKLIYMENYGIVTVILAIDEMACEEYHFS